MQLFTGQRPRTVTFVTRQPSCIMHHGNAENSKTVNVQAVSNANYLCKEWKWWCGNTFRKLLKSLKILRVVQIRRFINGNSWLNIFNWISHSAICRKPCTMNKINHIKYSRSSSKTTTKAKYNCDSSNNKVWSGFWCGLRHRNTNGLLSADICNKLYICTSKCIFN